MGIECVRMSEAAEVRALNGCESGSERHQRGVRRGCRVVKRRVQPRDAWGQDTGRRGTRRSAKFSKWDKDFMLQP